MTNPLALLAASGAVYAPRRIRRRGIVARLWNRLKRII